MQAFYPIPKSQLGRGTTTIAACTSLIHYLPLATTVVATVFLADLVRRYFTKGKGIHLLWWAGGIAAYGMGTALESVITLAGNTVLLNKSWYVMGALLGAYPLAQGTVYLLLRRRTANLLTVITLPLVFVMIGLVALCPIDLEVLEPHRPSGKALEWSWLRSLTPLINGYAALFLVGGAVFSSWRFARDRTMLHRAVGNALIAIGAIMPGIGGIVAKTGTIETLYITELTGLIFIWGGYSACVWPDSKGSQR